MSESNSNFNLHDLKCPACGARHMGVVEGKRLACQYCGADYVIAETVCPACGEVNDHGTDYCTKCGTAISRMCMACGTRNWADAEHCEHCGRTLDVVESLSERWNNSTRNRLQTQMHVISPALKQQEEASSQARMSALWDIENRRQQAIREAMARREREQRRLIVLAAVIVVAIAAVVAFALLVQLPR